MVKKLPPGSFPVPCSFLVSLAEYLGQYPEAAECGFQFQVCHQSTPLSLGEFGCSLPYLGLSLVMCRMRMLSRVTNCPGLLGAEGFLGLWVLALGECGRVGHPALSFISEGICEDEKKLLSV